MISAFDWNNQGCNSMNILVVVSTQGWSKPRFKWWSWKLVGTQIKWKYVFVSKDFLQHRSGTGIFIMCLGLHFPSVLHLKLSLSAEQSNALRKNLYIISSNMSTNSPNLRFSSWNYLHMYHYVIIINWLQLNEYLMQEKGIQLQKTCLNPVFGCKWTILPIWFSET